MTNSIRWDLPVETTEDPPRPVRVLATDRIGVCPIVIMFENGVIEAVPLNGCGANGLKLRNVAPPKPEPVLREAWISLYPRGLDGTFATKAFADEHADDRNRVECRRIAWMSDGSPVPGEDDQNMIKILTTERDMLKAEVTKWEKWEIEVSQPRLAKVKAERDYLRQEHEKAEARIANMQTEFHDSLEWDELIAERDRLHKANLRLMGEIGQMRPVVEAAISASEDYNTISIYDLFSAVRTYQNTLKKTAEEAVANVAKMMGPVKSCNTCKHNGPLACLAIDACPTFNLWEAKK